MSAANNLADPAPQPSNTDTNETESLMSLIVAPRIGISNEPELRLQMIELNEDDEKLRFLAYAEQDKGFVESQ